MGMVVSIQLLAQPRQEATQPVPFPKVEQQELFLQAIDALDTGKTNSMVKLLDRAIQLDSANPFAYVKRAQLFDLIGNDARAVQDYSTALGYNPKFADLYQLRGCSYFKMGNVLAAVFDWQRFIQLKPKKETEHWQICVGHALLGNYEEARKRFEWHWTANTEDMEVAFWHFLCVARTDGMAKAREKLISVSSEKRVPMPQLYALYKGTGHEAEVWLVRRADEGMLGGMRALPDDGWSARSDGSGQTPMPGSWEDVGAVRHTFTHAHLTLQVKRVCMPCDWAQEDLGQHSDLEKGDLEKGVWWPIAKLAEAGLPTVFAKAAARAQASREA